MDPDTRGIIIVAVLVGLMFRAGSFTTVRAAGKRALEIWGLFLSRRWKRKLRRVRPYFATLSATGTVAKKLGQGILVVEKQDRYSPNS